MKIEEGIERCGVCETWAATIFVRAGNKMYQVCDKPRCQDKISKLLPNNFNWETDVKLHPNYEKFLKPGEHSQ